MFWDFSFEQILIMNTTQKICEEFKLRSSQFFVPIFWKMEKNFSFGFVLLFFPRKINSHESTSIIHFEAFKLCLNVIIIFF